VSRERPLHKKGSKGLRLPFFATLIAGVVLLAAIGGWVLTRPERTSDEVLAGLVPDVAQGRRIFFAAGCGACHAAPHATKDAKLVLSGGRRFASPFGTFVAPNISPDPLHGIGRWSALDLYNALHFGTSPDGRHYYPAFPYTTFQNMRPQDVVSLRAFLATLPASVTPSQPHEVGFPFNIRRGLGLWKRLFLRPGWVVGGRLSEQEMRGRYLVEALGHCAECHTPRNLLGALRRDRWLGGAPNPVGKGRFPNITPAALDWSAVDIKAYLQTGFTPDYDSAGGEMVDVIDNLAHLPDTDPADMAAYLKRVPPLASKKP